MTKGWGYSLANETEKLPGIQKATDEINELEIEKDGVLEVDGWFEYVLDDRMGDEKWHVIAYSDAPSKYKLTPFMRGVSNKLNKYGYYIDHVGFVDEHIVVEKWPEDSTSDHRVDDTLE